jgi:hypothetical protein
VITIQNPQQQGTATQITIVSFNVTIGTGQELDPLTRCLKPISPDCQTSVFLACFQKNESWLIESPGCVCVCVCVRARVSVCPPLITFELISGFS